MKDSPNFKIEQLMKVFLVLETEKECELFFDDLCTFNEIKAFSQRLEVARMLLEGHTYEYIEEHTGATFNTISRVNKTLSKNNFLKSILHRLNNL
ncbi:MAG TPA: YerC/YecD family TrpR-related protein [Ureibacillus sp.]|nr:YerC/YecD family TrpR-related protein [Ureibacillus sp.]